MSDRTNLENLIHRTSQRTGCNSEVVSAIVEAFLDEIYLSLEQGDSVTIKNFGGFYVRPVPHSWVFKFNPSQKWRALFGWSSTYKG
jgi:DNA-binding protein HU-beta